MSTGLLLWLIIAACGGLKALADQKEKQVSKPVSEPSDTPEPTTRKISGHAWEQDEPWAECFDEIEDDL